MYIAHIPALALTVCLCLSLFYTYGKNRSFTTPSHRHLQLNQSSSVHALIYDLRVVARDPRCGSASRFVKTGRRAGNLLNPPGAPRHGQT